MATKTYLPKIVVTEALGKTFKHCNFYEVSRYKKLHCAIPLTLRQVVHEF